MSDWTDQIDRLRLVRTEGVGPVTYRRLLERYQTPAAALDALPRLARAGWADQGPLGRPSRGGGGARVRTHRAARRAA